MEINRNILIGLVKNLRPGIADKEIIEQSTHIIFNQDCICSYNDEIFVSIPLDCKFSGTVDADLLLRIVSKFEEEQIKVEVNPNKNKLDIYGDINSASIALVIDSTIFAHIAEVRKDYEKADWKTLPKDFQAALEMCSFSASKDRTQGALCCLRIEGEDILSTDKFRIGWYVMESSINKKFLLEADHALQLSRYSILTEFWTGKSWAHFRSKEGMVLSCRTIEPPDESIDLKPFFDPSPDAVRIKLPSDLIKRAELAGVLSEGPTVFDRSIEMKFEEDTVTCLSRSEKGEIESKSKLEKSVPFKLSFQISPDLLIDILKFVSSTVIFNKIDEEKGKVIFRTRSFSHCMMVRT
jgi:hypothetical protein